MRSASGSAKTMGGLIFSTFALGPSTVMRTLSPSMASLMWAAAAGAGALDALLCTISMPNMRPEPRTSPMHSYSCRHT